MVLPGAHLQIAPQPALAVAVTAVGGGAVNNSILDIFRDLVAGPLGPASFRLPALIEAVLAARLPGLLLVRLRDRGCLRKVAQCPVKPGLPPWGPHVRFRRVPTLVRQGSCGCRLRPRALTTEQLRPPAGRIPGGRMLACRKWGQRQTGYYYLSIPPGSCYCRPMICALVPFPNCSHRTPGRPAVGVFP